MLTNRPYDLDRVVRLLIGVAIILGIYFLLDRLSSVLVPFFLAWLTAYLLEPAVKLIQRLVRKRILSVLITVFGLFLGIGVVLALLVPAIIHEFQSLQTLLSSQLSQIHWPDWIPKDLAAQVNAQIKDLGWEEVLAQEEIMDRAAGAFSTIWGLLSDVFGVVMALFGIVTYLLYLVFIMMDYGTISSGWSNLIPEKYKGFVVQLISDMEVGMNGYFKAQSKIVFCVAILFAVGFKIIGLPFAISIGIVIGLMNYIPYAQLFGLVPTIALAGLHSMQIGDSFWMMLLFVLLVFLAVQALQDLLLTPYFMGEFSGFNPAIILLSLSIWGSLLGVVGIIIAIPLTSLVLAYYRRYILKKEEG